MVRATTIGVLVLVAISGCKKAKKGGGTTTAVDASAAPSPGVGDAGSAAVSNDGGDGEMHAMPVDTDARQAIDPALVKDAKAFALTEVKKVNATALGDVELTLLQLLESQNGDARDFDLELLIKGKGTPLLLTIASLGDMSLPEEAADSPKGMRLAIPAESPPRMATEADVSDMFFSVELPTKQPMLYLTGFHVPGGDDRVVVTHEGDALVVWHLVTDEESTGPAKWQKASVISLAKGAKVTAK